ncbi:hypothetical protein [Shewanella waksmanii]|uniref:hypothetical protein n=1 Tax=Shewanella waksmanii TaxID=213783 RepID=UPI003734D770
MKLFTLLLTLLICFTTNASSLLTLGPQDKSIILNAASPNQKHKFPALYVYDVLNQKFLSKEEATSYLQSMNEDPLWNSTSEQWTKNTEKFSANIDVLSKALPTLLLDKNYFVLYDNLPGSMLKQLKSMDPLLEQKDTLIKLILSNNEDARSYTTY